MVMAGTSQPIPCAEAGLPGILAPCSGLKDLADDNGLNLIRTEARAFQGRADGVGAQSTGGKG